MYLFFVTLTLFSSSSFVYVILILFIFMYMGESTRTQPLFGKSFFYRIFCAGHGDPHRETSLAEIFLLLSASLLEIEIVLSEHAK